MSQKLAKMLNKGLWLKVEGGYLRVGTYLRGHLRSNFPNRVGAYSNWLLIGGRHLFEDLWYVHIGKLIRC